MQREMENVCSEREGVCFEIESVCGEIEGVRREKKKGRDSVCRMIEMCL